mmetsp:Transcript_22090/g.52197  ORF Transcript_22090/g.52197 Transcript_22090/m.52197 type:complete len:589 (+) Transcript_22090:245-2011(+)
MQSGETGAGGPSNWEAATVESNSPDTHVSQQPPQPAARHHPYLPTAQPLYPEELPRKFAAGSGFEASGCRLALLEVDDVVLFPGATLPLRITNAAWVSHLGDQIDDARGLCGDWNGTHSGMGEVSLVVLPRVNRQERRTRRHQMPTVSRQSNAPRGRTGRWRVDLIRRGITSVRRGRTPRNELSHGSPADQDEALINDSDEDLGQESVDDDNLFRPSAPSRRVFADPFAGRIGTVATVTFTHEETTGEDAVTETPSTETPSRSRLWRQRRRGDELVITLVGIRRVRILQTVDEQVRRENGLVPLVGCKFIHDSSTAPPSAWLMQASSLSRSPLRTQSEDTEPSAAPIYDNSIHMLSLRSSIPSTAYKSIWPWRICDEIIGLICRSGLSSILASAAGVRSDSVEENDLMTGETGENLQVFDLGSFTNWLAQNLSFGLNERVDLLELTSTLEQLRSILSMMRKRLVESTLKCKHCGAAVSNICHLFSVGGSEGTTGAYVNCHGVVHQTATVKDIVRDSLLIVGSPSTQDSWFPGYAWEIALCSICTEHLGWRFTQVGRLVEDDPVRPGTFYGFSSVTTGSVAPRRTNFGS